MAWEAENPDPKRKARRNRPTVSAASVLLAAVALLASGLAPIGAPSGGVRAQTGGGVVCDQPVDVLLLFDTTGSMGGVIGDAKAGATDIVNDVQAAAPDTRFGVADYEDYPGSFSYPGYSSTYGDSTNVPWRLDQSLTTDTSAVQSAIDGLSANAGADFPESLSRALYESQDLGWRSNAQKIVVLFADAPPHDQDFAGNNYGGDPGPDATAQTADDLDFETQVQQAADQGIHLVTVDSGGGFASEYYQHMADETGGAYELLGDNFRDQVTDLILDLIPQPRNDARSTALTGEVSVPANPAVEVNPVKVSDGNDADNGTIAHAEASGLGASVSVASDGARVQRSDTEIEARANVTIDRFEVADGLVEGRNLHATVVSRTTAAGSTTEVVNASLGSVTVAGDTVQTDVGSNRVIAFPGGTVTLNETATASHQQGSEILVNLVHVVLDRPEARGDARIGHVFAGSGCGTDLGTLLETRDNDAGSGGDAPASPSQAQRLNPPTVVQGRTVDSSDSVDMYKVHVEPGEKIELALAPSTRAKATVTPPDEPNSGAVALPDMDLFLREPGTFDVRESSRLPASAPDRVELNVDEAGDWIVEVRRPFSTPGNYTLAASVTPIPLMEQNDDLSGADAPDDCRGAQPISDGVHPGVLRDDDFQDFYEVPADIGDSLVASVKPGEAADGANFDLLLYDGSCRFLQSSNLGSGIVPKGTPDAVSLTPVQASDDYVLEVRRVNGIGNYYLTSTVQDPQPTVGPLDAENGQDAGGSPSGAQAISNPFVGQGAFPDGDAADTYAVDLEDGDQLVASLKPSELSNFDLALIRPDGATVADSSAEPLSSPELIDQAIDETGTWFLRVDRVSGGGDYLLSVGAG